MTPPLSSRWPSRITRLSSTRPRRRRPSAMASSRRCVSSASSQHDDLTTRARGDVQTARRARRSTRTQDATFGRPAVSLHATAHHGLSAGYCRLPTSFSLPSGPASRHAARYGRGGRARQRAGHSANDSRADDESSIMQESLTTPAFDPSHAPPAWRRSHD